MPAMHDEANLAQPEESICPLGQLNFTAQGTLPVQGLRLAALCEEAPLPAGGYAGAGVRLQL